MFCVKFTIQNLLSQQPFRVLLFFTIKRIIIPKLIYTCIFVLSDTVFLDGIEMGKFGCEKNNPRY